MTSNDITRLCYSGSIGFLGGFAFGPWGLIIVPCIILGSNVVGILFGDDR